MIQPLRDKSQFEVEDYMILRESDFKGKFTYKTQLTIKGSHSVLRGDEVTNASGNRWVVVRVEPDKLVIIGISFGKFSAMKGSWLRVGNNYKME
jgi:hypothetical protein